MIPTNDTINDQGPLVQYFGDGSNSVPICVTQCDDVWNATIVFNETMTRILNPQSNGEGPSGLNLNFSGACHKNIFAIHSDYLLGTALYVFSVVQGSVSPTNTVFDTDIRIDGYKSNISLGVTASPSRKNRIFWPPQRRNSPKRNP